MNNSVALKMLPAIVETGSLVRASQVLNVTQTTVTAWLKSLEDELGQQTMDAPVYARKKNLIVNNASMKNWDWFGPLVHRLRRPS